VCVRECAQVTRGMHACVRMCVCVRVCLRESDFNIPIVYMGMRFTFAYTCIKVHTHDIHISHM